MYDINYRRKRVREEISEGADADDTEDHSLFRFKNYWPVADPADNDSSTRYNVMWYDYPFLPQSHILSCDDEIFYEPAIPDDLSTVQAYSRADFWNLSPWIGPPLVWGIGHGFGIEVRQDPAPWVHECTLARDFISHWPLRGADPSIIGSCASLIPMVCAYCWGHTWRRCDTVPRVGAYETQEAHMSPVLELCDHCGLTSDYNISRCIALNSFEFLQAFVNKGEANVRDIFRCLVGVNMWATPTGFATCSSEQACRTYGSMTWTMRSFLLSVLGQCAPDMQPITGITSIIMLYWQGIDMTSEGPRPLEAIMPRQFCDPTQCSHAFPCIPGEECMWADWAFKWGWEVSQSNVRWIDKYRDHASTWFPGEVNWQPNSWSVWDIIRDHKCNSDDDDHEEWLGRRREDRAADAVLMARDHARGFLVDTDSDEGDVEGDDFDFDAHEAAGDAADVAAGCTNGLFDDGGDVPDGGDEEMIPDGGNVPEAVPVVGPDELDAEADMEKDEFELKLYRDGWE